MFYARGRHIKACIFLISAKTVRSRNQRLFKYKHYYSTVATDIRFVIWQFDLWTLYFVLTYLTICLPLRAARPANTIWPVWTRWAAGPCWVAWPTCRVGTGGSCSKVVRVLRRWYIYFPVTKTETNSGQVMVRNNNNNIYLWAESRRLKG